MRRLMLGVVGHVDHGKTALVRALTGADTDRLAEEKARGISIALGFAHFRASPDTEIDLIDMPGHERFVRTMVSGATGIDAVLLVIAANEGVKPQTVEHIEIAGLLGLRRAVVAVSKIDLVSAEEALLVAEEAIELLDRVGIEAAAPIMTSATTGQGIAELRDALTALAMERRPRANDGIVFMPIDRAFSVPGHGPVVTGTLRGGAITHADRLELLPLRRTVRLRKLQVHGQDEAAAQPGQRVALNLRDVELGELHRGMALAAPDALRSGEWLTLAIRALASAPAMKNGKRLRALFGTQEVDVRLRLLDRDEIAPGESGFAQLRCVNPVALPAGEHVILRLVSPARTVAGGRLLECGAKRRKRGSDDVLARLRLLASGSPAEVIAAEVLRRSRAGASLQRLSGLTGLALPHVIALLETLPVTIARGDIAVSREQLDALRAQLAVLLTQVPGATLDELKAAMPDAGPVLLDLALTRLLAEGILAKRDNRYVVPRPEDDRARAEGEARLAAEIAERLRQGGLSPPRPAEIVTDAGSRRAVDRLIREGTVVRALDRAKHKEILFHQDAIDDACRRLEPLLEGGGLGAGEIGAALGVSRKYTMPLLDHLDTIRFTRRVGDMRLLHVAAPAS